MSEEKIEYYIINGGKPLKGKVEISGAKNAALALLAAAIMTDEDVTIENIPDVNDINVMIQAIAEIGATVERIDRHCVKINGSTIKSCNVDYDYMKKIRASYYLLGALLGKKKEAEVALPGGCEIGSRPIDYHIKGFQALGVKVENSNGMVYARTEHLTGNKIFFDKVSVGATINVMLAASLAEGNTVIENSAKEPHVVDVANMLNKMGANIRGAGTDVIRIKGVQKLHGTEYHVVPDQIEAGTFMCMAAATRGDILIKNIIPRHLDCISAKLLEIGCSITEYDDEIRVRGAQTIRHTNVITSPYPGFPTDMQPQITVALSLSDGESTVIENIFESRFKYTAELNRMGANISVNGTTANVVGVGKLSGARVCTPDLRAGAALVIAGLAAEGRTTVDDIKYILRGYERFDEKIRGLGGDIIKVSDDNDRIVKSQIKVVS